MRNLLQQAAVSFDVPAPIKPKRIEGSLREIAYRVHLSRSHDEVTCLAQLQNAGHCVHVVRCVAPIDAGLEISQNKPISWIMSAPAARHARFFGKGTTAYATETRD